MTDRMNPLPFGFPSGMDDRRFGDFGSPRSSDPLDERIFSVVESCLCGSIPTSVLKRIIFDECTNDPVDQNPFDDLIVEASIDVRAIREDREVLREEFPKALTERYMVLQNFVDQEREVNQWLANKAPQCVLSWVRRALATEKDLALALMDTQLSQIYFIDAFFRAHNRAGLPYSMSAKGKGARKGKPLGLETYFRWAIVTIRKALESRAVLDDDSVYILALDTLLGRASNLLAFALGMHCGRTLEAVAFLTKNCNPDFLAALVDRLPLDTPDAIGSMLTQADFPDVCEPTAMLLSQLDDIGLHALIVYADVWRDSFMAIAGDLENTSIECAKLVRAAEQKTRAAERSVKQSQVAVERIGKAKEPVNVKALKAQINDLSREVDTLRNQLARRDARLVTLEARLAGSPANDPPAETLGLPAQTCSRTSLPVAAAPVPKISYDDALAHLRSLRGVLVGGHTNFVNKIRLLLPNWAFFSNEAKRVDDALIEGADLVVFFTASCSHTLTESAMRIVRAGNKVCCYGSRVNPPAFICEIAGQNGNLSRQVTEPVLHDH